LLPAIIPTHRRRTIRRRRGDLIQWYGEDRGKAVKYAEAFELCECGRKPTAAELKQLFPFFETEK
jgi:N-acetylglucosamine malate deacetylase 1